MSQESGGRLRPHPQDRFRPAQHLVDLEQAATDLAAEGDLAHGHRQKVLYRHGPLTIALFLFEAGAGLAQHKADGVVTIHTIQGRLHVIAEGEEHDLPVGRLLVLAPGVAHDVRAETPSRVLLTVSREAAGAAPSSKD